MYKKLKGRIKGCIGRKGTQKELAPILGMSTATLTQKLNGKADWKLSEVKKLSHILGIDKREVGDYFFEEEDD